MSDPALFEWLEIDCPGCGVDFDIFPDTLVEDMRLGCGCGAVWDRKVLATANVYDVDRNILDNPWRD